MCTHRYQAAVRYFINFITLWETCILPISICCHHLVLTLILMLPFSFLLLKLATNWVHFQKNDRLVPFTSSWDHYVYIGPGWQEVHKGYADSLIWHFTEILFDNAMSNYCVCFNIKWSQYWFAKRERLYPTRVSAN